MKVGHVPIPNRNYIFFKKENSIPSLIYTQLPHGKPSIDFFQRSQMTSLSKNGDAQVSRNFKLIECVHCPCFLKYCESTVLSSIEESLNVNSFKFRYLEKLGNKVFF